MSSKVNLNNIFLPFMLLFMPLLHASVGIIFDSSRTQLLLVKRKDVAVWVLPGGGIEAHEKPEEALIREIEEETGYRVKILRPCAHYLPMNRLASETFVYLCQIESGRPILSQETSSMAFFPLTELPCTLFFPHALWIQEALGSEHFINRPLKEISYWALFKYFLKHPLQVLRFAWTRLTHS